MSGEGESNATSAPKDEFDALPLFVQRVTRPPRPPTAQAKKTADNGASSSTGSKESVLHPASPSTQVPPLQRSAVRKILPGLVEECYATDNAHRGVCVILEHDTYLPDMNLSPRKGSEVDLKEAVSCFESMGFEVVVERNLRYVDMMRLLSRIAAMDHSDSDCLVVALLSHGNDGSVYAYDAAFPTQRLWEPFVGDKAPTLVGKPKLFFIQACQGAGMDEGVRVARKGRATETDSFASYKVPGHTDFVIAHSTVAGFYSWRNTVQGSWYMQALTKVLVKERQERDLLSMLTNVNKVVSVEYESSSSRPEFNYKKQTPFIYSTLTRKLYLEDKLKENE